MKMWVATKNRHATVLFVISNNRYELEHFSIKRTLFFVTFFLSVTLRCITLQEFVQPASQSKDFLSEKRTERMENKNDLVRNQVYPEPNPEHAPSTGSCVNDSSLHLPPVQ